ncbi:uncharacterized protein LOC111253713 [Varroa destructor]|uniref:Uncharacterized protein n=1 Tax=Varroa destructor TaxID=109461 RepID=A0A7M7KQF0_VARDE|nr:uncharacterized protein LOC111253713 [Varroa destructor]
MLEKISADVTKRRPRAKLVQWHQGLVKIDTELRNSKCLYDDIKFGIKIAMYLSRHPQIYVRHIYFEKKIEVFRRQLEDIRCWIDNLDVQRAFKRRAASPSLSEIKKALQVQRSLLQRLAQKYALTKDRILLTERDAYGLVKNVIPYSQRFSMPRIPDSERVISVFSPLDFERRPSDNVLVPKFILTQRDEVQRDAPSKLARGLFKLPKEDKLWRELAREAERRDEKSRKKKLQAAEAERTADKVRNQKGPRRSKNQQAHFLDESS